MYRYLVRRAIFAIAVAALGSAPVAAQVVPFPRDRHPWGRFPAGSWKLVRATTETLDDKEQVVNVAITETRTTLAAVNDSTYTLRSEAKVNVTGRQIPAAPHVAQHGYYGESPGKGVSVRKTGEAVLTIDGRAVPCELREVLLEGDGGKLKNTMYFSAEVPPFVLRREITMDANGEEKRNSTLVEVVALDLPQRIRNELRPASFVKTTQKLPQGTKVTLEVHSDEVPGGVAAHWSTETDAQGHIIRRSTLELIDFGLGAAPSEGPVILPRRLQRKAIRRSDPRFP
jgi:hypothetical protein